MIKTSDQMLKDVKEHMRGGTGSVELLHIMNKGEFKAKVGLCVKATLNPGCSIGLHEHKDEEELYYILKGKALMEDGSETREIKAGDAVLTGGGASHSIKNIGEDVLEFFAIVVQW